MAIVYEQAGFEDLHEVAELYNEFLFSLKDITRDPYFDFADLSVKDRAKLLKDRYLEDKGLVIIARNDEDGSIIGFLSMARMNCFLMVSSVREIGYIEGAYVRKAYRRQGILSRLESMLTDRLRELGIRYVELNTIANNQMANDSWSNLGYRVFRQQWRKDLHG